MATTGIPSTTPPAPPTGQAPPPQPPPAPPPRSGRSRPVYFLLFAILGAAALVAAFVVFGLVGPKNDAKDVLRDARPTVQRSLVVSREARSDVTRFMRTDSAQARRQAVAGLDRVITLRRRAIRRLDDMDEIGFPGDSNYKDAAEVWSDTLRGSIKAARGLRGMLPKTVSPGYLERRAEATMVVTQSLTLRRYDQILRQTDREVIADLV